MSTTANKQNARTSPATPASAGSNADASVALHDAVRLFPKYVAFLRERLGVGFRGRVLELGAGPAWFTAELSKLPKVVEVIATDFTHGPLPEQAPLVLQALRARQAKITRRQVSAQRLDFPDHHFDFVVCNAVLHNALNLPQLLREARRVLKPGGQLIAVREPVKSLMGWRSGSRTAAQRKPLGMNSPIYSRADYLDLFDRAGFSVKASRVSLASGLRYYFDTVINGLTHARYVFVATRRERANAGRGKKFPV